MHLLKQHGFSKKSTIHTAFGSTNVRATRSMAGNVLLRTAMDDEDQLEVLKPQSRRKRRV